MMRTLAFALILAIAIVGVASSQSVGSHEPQGEVGGSITLINDGARLPGAAVTFDRGGKKYSARTDDAGAYHIALPVGEYSLEVYRTGLCRMRRGIFVITAGAQIQFDFELMTCPSDLPGKYNYATLEVIPDTGIQPLVLFGNSTTSDDTTFYTGPVVPLVKNTGPSGYPSQKSGLPLLEQKSYPVVLSYNLLTVRASTISYNEATRQAVATGNVRVHDDKVNAKGSRAVVTLSGLHPKIEMTRQESGGPTGQ